MKNDNNVNNEYSDYISRQVSDDSDKSIFSGSSYFQYEYVVLIIAILALIGSVALIIYLIATTRKYTTEDTVYKPTRQAEELIIDLSGNSCGDELIEDAVAGADDIRVSFQYSKKNVKLCDLEQTTNAKTKECALVDSEEYAYDIMVSGIPKDYYITIEDDNTYTPIVYDSGAIVDGVATHQTDLTGVLTTYTISVYYTDTEFKSCSDQLVKRFTLTTPKYNDYYNSNICYNMEDYKYCLEFIYEDISNIQIYENIMEYAKEHKIVSKEEAMFNQDMNNKLKLAKYILISIIAVEFIIVVIIMVILYIVSAKRKKKEAEEA